MQVFADNYSLVSNACGGLCPYHVFFLRETLWISTLPFHSEKSGPHRTKFDQFVARRNPDPNKREPCDEYRDECF